MSIARITRVAKARKRPRGAAPHQCGKCGTVIEPGTSYLWYAVGFRARPTFRCSKSSCSPKQSELESSQLADIYAAIEGAEEQIEGIDATNVSDFESQAQDILQEVQGAIDEVAEAYEEADEAMGGTQSTEAYERADTLRQNDLTSFSLSVSDPEGCGDAWKGEGDDEKDDHSEPEDGCDDCGTSVSDWLDEAKQELNDALSEVEMP